MPAPPDPTTGRRARIERHARVSAALAGLGDGELAALAPDRRGTLRIAGETVFAKRVPLTDWERRAEHWRSPDNLFGVPAFCYYGFGSPGFTAWRELAANLILTGRELAGKPSGSPLLYHWRVLPGAEALPAEFADRDRTVAFWGGGTAVRHRLDALAHASASVLLCAEHIPWRLADWLAGQLAGGTIGAAAGAVDRWLRRAVRDLNGAGVRHFDAHFHNVLTDGRRVFLADLGLAGGAGLGADPAEAVFLTRHRHYDLCYVLTHLVNWLVSGVCGIPVPQAGGPVERNAYIRHHASGPAPVGVPAAVAEIIHQYAPVAAVFNDFVWALFDTGPATVRYPAEELAQALAGLDPGTVPG